MTKVSENLKSAWFIENFGEEVANKLSREEKRYVMRIMNSASKERGKRRTIRVLRYDVATGTAVEIPTSETRWVRSLYDNLDSIEDHIVVDFDKNNKTAEKNNGLVFTHGVRINPDKIECKDEERLAKWKEAVRGKVFRAFIQSPSQQRTASAVFMAQIAQDYASQWIDSIRKVMKYMPDKMAVVKFLSAAGLSQSSSKEFRRVTFEIIPDYEAPLPNGDMHAYSDGFGKIRMSTMKELADREGLNYLPSGVQVRLVPAFKGFLVADKDEEFPEGVEVLVTESMAKVFREGQDNAMLEYCLFSKPAKELTPCCYQYIQATAISGESLKMFVNRHLGLLHGILQDPAKAMKYLGMVSRETGDSDDDAETMYEEELNSKVMRALDANPSALYDPWIQARLKQTMERTIDDMAKGRVPLNASYWFIITEPRVLSGSDRKGKEPLLKAGQAYLNGYTGKVACFRSPLIHRSEAQVVELVTSPELEEAYGHIKDILILNCKDDALPRAGGADCDGDKFFVCFEPEIVNAVDMALEAIVSEGKGSPSKIMITYQAVLAHMARNAKKSMVGFVTDLGTTWSDMFWTEQDPEKKDVYDKKIRRCRVLQGQIIDAPKTGENVVIPEEVQTPYRPHWLGRSGMNIKSYHSTSPMGLLYDYVQYAKKVFMEQNQGMDYSLVLSVLEQADPQGYTLVFDQIKEYLIGYKTEVGNVVRMFLNKENTPEVQEERSKLMGDIANKYRDLMDSLTCLTDPVTIAGIAYYLTYQTHNNMGNGNGGYSFPWVTCFEGLIEGLSRIGGSRFMLVPFKSQAEELPEKITVANKLAFAEGKFVGIAKVDDGDYETFIYNNLKYVKVPRTKSIQAMVIPQSRFQVGVVGLTPEVAKSLVTLVGHEVSIKRFQPKEGIIASAVFYEQYRLGKISDDSLLQAALLLDRPVRVLQVVPSSTGKSANMVFEAV